VTDTARLANLIIALRQLGDQLARLHDTQGATLTLAKELLDRIERVACERSET